jgi:hypothetical protein
MPSGFGDLVTGMGGLSFGQFGDQEVGGQETEKSRCVTFLSGALSWPNKIFVDLRKRNPNCMLPRLLAFPLKRPCLVKRLPVRLSPKSYILLPT